MFSYGLIIITFVFMGISWAVGAMLKSRFKKYSQVPTASGLSGAEIAAQMLRENNIHDVEIMSTPGKLTDHYNPQNKTINLSNEVFHGRNVSAAAVAAHETGHAIQHATSYAFLAFRSAMVPVVNLSSKLMNIIFMVMIFGSFAFHFFPFDMVLWTIIIAQGAITLFSLITLPVEIDASNRALIWLKSSNTTVAQEYGQAKDALKWAAYTYVVAALAAVANLLYWVAILLGRRD